MKGLSDDVGRLRNTRGKVDMARVPMDFPHLVRLHQSTWGQMMDTRIKDPRLKGVLSSQWDITACRPRSSPASTTRCLPGIPERGRVLPQGRSQDISNAFSRLIESRGGKILLNTRVAKIRVKDGAASGVTTADGRTLTARVVVSNASPFATLGTMIDDQALVADYQARCREYSVSLSCFQVFLGLGQDLTRKLGIATPRSSASLRTIPTRATRAP